MQNMKKGKHRKSYRNLKRQWFINWLLIFHVLITIFNKVAVTYSCMVALSFYYFFQWLK